MYTRQWALDRRLKVSRRRFLIAIFTLFVSRGASQPINSRCFVGDPPYRTVESDDLKYRAVELRIGDQDRTLAIAFFHEWSLTEGYFPRHDHFIEFADAITQHEYDMAEFVSICWDDDDHPLYYGNIVLFDRLSIAEPNPLI